MCWFAIFNFFLNHLCSHFKSRSNSRRPPSVLGGWGTKFCDGVRGYTPSWNLHVFSLIFQKCSLCSPCSNLNLNRFSFKKIQYMDAGLDNS
jgi:hypothetical protein